MCVCVMYMSIKSCFVVDFIMILSMNKKNVSEHLLFLNKDTLKCRTLATLTTCIFEQQSFCASKGVNREERYCWTRIHHFSVNCLKASTDNVEQPNGDFVGEGGGVLSI